jgi:glutamate-1-semialdehyde 2,1-aminomutase
MVPQGQAGPAQWSVVRFPLLGDDDTFVIDHGLGGHVFDMDGNEYIDYQLGFGPVILGHARSARGDAVAHAATRGTTFAMTQRAEVEAAEKVLGATRLG